MQSACNQSVGAAEEEHLMSEAISRNQPQSAAEEEHLDIVYGHRACTQPRGRRRGPWGEVNRWQTP
jgi:hypothetical protein